MLTGQAGSPIGGSASSSTAEEVSVTTTVTGSRVYGAVTDNSSHAGFTAAAGTTLIDNVTDSVNNASYGTCKATALTGTPGPTTLGATAPDARGGLRCWKSSPGPASPKTVPPPPCSPSTALSALTTAAFTPPAGLLLAALVSARATAAPRPCSPCPAAA